MTPRDAEERRIVGGTVPPTARDVEEKRFELRPGRDDAADADA
jgi:hypothetical protein